MCKYIYYSNNQEPPKIVLVILFKPLYVTSLALFSGREGVFQFSFGFWVGGLVVKGLGGALLKVWMLNPKP